MLTIKRRLFQYRNRYLYGAVAAVTLVSTFLTLRILAGMDDRQVSSTKSTKAETSVTASRSNTPVPAAQSGQSGSSDPQPTDPAPVAANQPAYIYAPATRYSPMPSTSSRATASPVPTTTQPTVAPPAVISSPSPSPSTSPVLPVDLPVDTPVDSVLNP